MKYLIVLLFIAFSSIAKAQIDPEDTAFTKPFIRGLISSMHLDSNKALTKHALHLMVLDYQFLETERQIDSIQAELDTPRILTIHDHQNLPRIQMKDSMPWDKYIPSEEPIQHDIRQNQWPPDRGYWIIPPHDTLPSPSISGIVPFQQEWDSCKPCLAWDVRIHKPDTARILIVYADTSKGASHRLLYLRGYEIYTPFQTQRKYYQATGSGKMSPLPLSFVIFQTVILNHF